MSHENQSEMLKIIAMNVLRKVGGDLQAAVYMIVMDKYTDISATHQNVRPLLHRFFWKKLI